MNWLFFAILAPALYALSTMMDKFLIEKRVKDPVLLTVLGGFITFFLGTLIFIAKSFPLLSPGETFFVLTAGLLAELALMPYYKALSLDDASRVIPFFQIIPVMVLILSSLFLKESLNPNEYLGFFFVLLGGGMLSIKKSESGSFKIRKSFWYIMAASLLFSLPSIFFKFVVQTNDFWTTMIYEFWGITIGAFIIYAFRRKKLDFSRNLKEIPKNTWPTLASNEVIYTLSQLSGLYAVSLAPVALVSVLSSSTPAFVMIYGIILSVWFPKIIKEDLKRSTVVSKIMAIALTMAGIFFINK
ncbi:EamA family transporter [Patescibacteria group bacterium]|nr:EamA family transporter [Patescibacteria group bacterium]